MYEVRCAAAIRRSFPSVNILESNCMYMRLKSSTANQRSKLGSMSLNMHKHDPTKLYERLQLFP